MVIEKLLVKGKSAAKIQLTNVISFQLLIHSNLSEAVNKETQLEWVF